MAGTGGKLPADRIQILRRLLPHRRVGMRRGNHQLKGSGIHRGGLLEGKNVIDKFRIPHRFGKGADSKHGNLMGLLHLRKRPGWGKPGGCPT